MHLLSANKEGPQPFIAKKSGQSDKHERIKTKLHFNNLVTQKLILPGKFDQIDESVIDIDCQTVFKHFPSNRSSEIEARTKVMYNTIQVLTSTLKHQMLTTI